MLFVGVALVAWIVLCAVIVGICASAKEGDGRPAASPAPDAAVGPLAPT